MDSKRFKVAAVSSNTNSFGLREHVLIAKDGEAWKCLVNSLHTLKVGCYISLPYETQPTFATPTWSAESPSKIMNAPEEVVNVVWDDAFGRSLEN